MLEIEMGKDVALSFAFQAFIDVYKALSRCTAFPFLHFFHSCFVESEVLLYVLK